MRMVSQNTAGGQRIDEILRLWSLHDGAGLPTLAEVDPILNFPTHISWVMLINPDGVCRLAGGDFEEFIDRECKGEAVRALLTGKAGIILTDAVAEAFKSGRPQIRETKMRDITFALIAAPYVSDTAGAPEKAGVLLSIATNALSLRTLNSALCQEQADVINHVA